MIHFTEHQVGTITNRLVKLRPSETVYVKRANSSLVVTVAVHEEFDQDKLVFFRSVDVKTGFVDEQSKPHVDAEISDLLGVRFAPEVLRSYALDLIHDFCVDYAAYEKDSMPYNGKFGQVVYFGDFEF